MPDEKSSYSQDRLWLLKTVERHEIDITKLASDHQAILSNQAVQRIYNAIAYLVASGLGSGLMYLFLDWKQ